MHIIRKFFISMLVFFFFQAEDGIRDRDVTGVQTCALPILRGQRGDRDRANLLQREVEQHELGDVRQREHHAVERPEPELEQVERQVLAFFVYIVIGERLLAVDQGNAMLEACKNSGKFLGQRLVLPVALLAVAPRELGRERDDACEHYWKEESSFNIRSSWRSRRR